MRSLLCVIGAVVYAACATPSPVAAAPPSIEAASLFRFHVDFWANLNQVLLHESLVPRSGFEGP